MSARIARNTDLPNVAESHLRDTANTVGPLTPIALIELVDNLFDRGVPIDDATLLSLESYATEQKLSEVGAQLNRAFVLGLALSGQFARAFALPHDDPATYWNALFSRLVTAADVDDFLAFASSPDPQRASLLSATTKTQISERFAQLGLSELAEQWTASASDIASDSETRRTNRRPKLSPVPETDGLVSETETFSQTTANVTDDGYQFQPVTTQDTDPADQVNLGSGISPAIAPASAAQPPKESEPQSVGPLAFARGAGAQARATIQSLHEILDHRDPELDRD